MKGNGGNVRTLASELAEYFQQKVPELIQKKEEAEKSLESQLATSLDPKSPNYWHDRTDLQERLSALKKDLVALRSRRDERFFVQRLRQIASKKNVRERFLSEFFPALSSIQTTNGDHCMQCGSSCLLNKNIARLVCVACGCMRRIVTNLCSATSKTSYGPTSSGQVKKPATSSSSSLQRNEHVRIKWLHKQLQQYRIGSKKIPKEDIFAVARRLRSMHLKSVSVVKHTITRSILKALNKTDCVSQASKIADICNGTPVAAFNDEQYLNVFQRLLAVQKVYIDFKTEKKSEKLTRVNFPPFQFLMKQFCILEGWHDLQECFTHSKTLEVYQTQISEWRIFLPRLKAADPGHNWDYPDQRSSLDALRLL